MHTVIMHVSLLLKEMHLIHHETSSLLRISRQTTFLLFFLLSHYVSGLDEAESDVFSTNYTLELHVFCAQTPADPIMPI